MANQTFINNLASKIQELNSSAHLAGDICICVDGFIPFGAHALDGSELDKTTYATLWNKVKSQAITEEEWQRQASQNNGDCSKYAHSETATTFRLPRVTGYLKSDATVGYIPEGLPNIVGSFLGTTSKNSKVTGAMYNSEEVVYNTTAAWAQSGNMYEIFLDASRSNSVYGTSSHVTPVTTKVILCVYLVNVGGYREVSEYSAGAQELKLLSNNLSALTLRVSELEGGGPTTVAKVTETKLNEDGSWYRKWSDGFIEQRSKCPVVTVDRDTTVSFIQPYSQENSVQVLLATNTRLDKSDVWVSCYQAYNVNSTSFTYRASLASANVSYYACGY